MSLKWPIFEIKILINYSKCSCGNGDRKVYMKLVCQILRQKIHCYSLSQIKTGLLLCNFSINSIHSIIIFNQARTAVWEYKSYVFMLGSCFWADFSCCMFSASFYSLCKERAWGVREKYNKSNNPCGKLLEQWPMTVDMRCMPACCQVLTGPKLEFI